MNKSKYFQRLWSFSFSFSFSFLFLFLFLLCSFSALSQNKSTVESQTWVFVGIVKNETTDIHQRFYTDWEQITYYLQDLPIQLTQDRVSLGDICSFQFSKMNATEEFLDEAYRYDLKNKIDIVLDEPISKLSINRENSDCLPLYNDLFGQFYLVDDKLMIEYDHSLFVYEQWEYVHIPNDKNKSIAILPPKYPYWCEEVNSNDCSEYKPIKRFLEKVFYIPYNNRIYIVLHEPKDPTLEKHEAKYIVGTYDENKRFKVKAIFIPQGFDIEYHIEKDIFVANIFPKIRH